MFLDGMFFGAPTISLPSLKSNSSPLENGWLEYFLVSFWEGLPIFHGAFAVSFKEFGYPVWCLEAEWERCACIIFLHKKTNGGVHRRHGSPTTTTGGGVRRRGGTVPRSVLEGFSWSGWVRDRKDPLGIVGLHNP